MSPPSDDVDFLAFGLISGDFVDERDADVSSADDFSSASASAI
jgi:hypothetical protein